MRIHILCSDRRHPVLPWLERWVSALPEMYKATIFHQKKKLSGGDALFLISCAEVIEPTIREKYRYALVLHASDLPKGRGWSPHVWQLLEGATSLTVSMLSAEDRVDSGAIWAKKRILIPPDALFDEINARLFAAEIDLLTKALHLIEQRYVPTPQNPDIAPSFYPRRGPKDSEIDPECPLAESFNKIRIMDADRYPAFFRLHGHTYRIRLEKVKPDEIN